MPRWQIRWTIACAAIIGWSLAYALASWSRWPRLFYDPLARTWFWARSADSPVPIDYWGLTLWGLGGAVVAVLLALAGTRLWHRPLPRAAIGLFGAWALTAFLYAGTYFMWSLWPF